MHVLPGVGEFLPTPTPILTPILGQNHRLRLRTHGSKCSFFVNKEASWFICFSKAKKYELINSLFSLPVVASTTMAKSVCKTAFSESRD